MFEHRGYRQVWAACVAEARKVHVAAGVRRIRSFDNQLLLDNFETLLHLPSVLTWFIARSIGLKGSKTSTLQDLEKGVMETEVSFLIGRVVTLGEQFKVPTPVNQRIAELVEEVSHKGQGSPRLSPQQLCNAVGL